MEDKVCPVCPNHCPEDQLICGRGRKYFGKNEGGEHGGRGAHGGHGFSESSDEVVNLLLKIGHTLHHSHGVEDVKLDCLSADERVQLTALLKKCLSAL